MDAAETQDDRTTTATLAAWYTVRHQLPSGRNSTPSAEKGEFQMRKLAFVIMFLALLAGCSGHGSSTPAPGPAAQSGARAPQSLGGAGTTSLTYNATYTTYSGNCNPNTLLLTN